jgi:AraC-like DNA-binding protein
MFRYAIFKPAPYLNPWIENYHFIEGYSIPYHQKTSCIGKITFLINYGDPFSTYEFENIVHRYENNIYCSGIFSTPRDYAGGIKNLKVVIVDFRHSAASCIFRENMDQLTNNAVEVRNLISTRLLKFLPEKLMDAKNFNEKIEILNREFTRYIRSLEIRSNPLVDEIISIIELRKGNIGLREISDEVAYSERTIRRKMIESLGISPIQYTRTLRSEYAIARFLFQSGIDYHDIVEDFGYYDQAHLINDFKRAISMTPAELKRMADHKMMDSLRALLRHRF